MAKLRLTEEEAELCEAVGTRTFLLARDQVRDGAVVDPRWEPHGRRVTGRLAGHGQAEPVVAELILDREGRLARLAARCGCAHHPACAHPAALVLAAIAGGGRPTDQVAAPGAWELALSSFLAVPPPTAAGGSDRPGLALQFDLVAPPGGKGGGGSGWRIGLRPVVPGQAGWVRTGVSWMNLGYAQYGRSARAERHRQLLNEIMLLPLDRAVLLQLPATGDLPG